jgi:hypothetical protein
VSNYIRVIRKYLHLMWNGMSECLRILCYIWVSYGLSGRLFNFYLIVVFYILVLKGISEVLYAWGVRYSRVLIRGEYCRFYSYINRFRAWRDPLVFIVNYRYYFVISCVYYLDELHAHLIFILTFGFDTFHERVSSFLREWLSSVIKGVWVKTKWVGNYIFILDDAVAEMMYEVEHEAYEKGYWGTEAEDMLAYFRYLLHSLLAEMEGCKVSFPADYRRFQHFYEVGVRQCLWVGNDSKWFRLKAPSLTWESGGYESEYGWLEGVLVVEVERKFLQRSVRDVDELLDRYHRSVDVSYVVSWDSVEDDEENYNLFINLRKSADVEELEGFLDYPEITDLDWYEYRRSFKCWKPHTVSYPFTLDAGEHEYVFSRFPFRQLWKEDPSYPEFKSVADYNMWRERRNQFLLGWREVRDAQIKYGLVGKRADIYYEENEMLRKEDRAAYTRRMVVFYHHILIFLLGEDSMFLSEVPGGAKEPFIFNLENFLRQNKFKYTAEFDTALYTSIQYFRHKRREFEIKERLSEWAEEVGLWLSKWVGRVGVIKVKEVQFDQLVRAVRKHIILVPRQVIRGFYVAIRFFFKNFKVRMWWQCEKLKMGLFTLKVLYRKYFTLAEYFEMQEIGWGWSLRFWVYFIFHIGLVVGEICIYLVCCELLVANLLDITWRLIELAQNMDAEDGKYNFENFASAFKMQAYTANFIYAGQSRQRAQRIKLFIGYIYGVSRGWRCHAYYLQHYLQWCNNFEGMFYDWGGKKPGKFYDFLKYWRYRQWILGRYGQLYEWTTGRPRFFQFLNLAYRDQAEWKACLRSFVRVSHTIELRRYRRPISHEFYKRYDYRSLINRRRRLDIEAIVERSVGVFIRPSWLFNYRRNVQIVDEIYFKELSAVIALQEQVRLKRERLSSFYPFDLRYLWRKLDLFFVKHQLKKRAFSLYLKNEACRRERHLVIRDVSHVDSRFSRRRKVLLLESRLKRLNR